MVLAKGLGGVVVMEVVVWMRMRLVTSVVHELLSREVGGCGNEPRRCSSLLRRRCSNSPCPRPLGVREPVLELGLDCIVVVEPGVGSHHGSLPLARKEGIHLNYGATGLG
jgi:hypothetical protein